MIASEQGSLRSKLDVLSAEFDVFEHKFDVIVNEVKKYSPNASKV